MTTKRRSNGEGSISGPRADGRYEGKYADQDGKRRTLYGKSRAEVAAKLREALDRADRGEAAVETRLTVAAAAEAWRHTAVARHGMRPSSLDTYSRVLRCQVVPRIGNVPLRDLRSSHVAALLTEMEAAGLSASYRSQARKVVSMVCSAAVADGLLRRNPVVSVRAPSVPARSESRVVPSREQVRAMIDQAPTPRLRMLVALIGYTGLRIGEALGVRWSDWNGGDTLAVTTTKGKRGRAVPVTPALASEFKAWRRAQAEERLAAVWWDDDHDWLVSTSIGTQWHQANARRDFRAVANGTPASEGVEEVAGVCPGLSPHGLRHAAATMLLEQGVPMKVVSELLGHATTKTTAEVYSHVTARLVAEAGAALEQALAP